RNADLDRPGGGHPMRRVWLLVAGMALLAALGTGGYLAWQRWHSPGEERIGGRTRAAWLEALASPDPAHGGAVAEALASLGEPRPPGAGTAAAGTRGEGCPGPGGGGGGGGGRRGRVRARAPAGSGRGPSRGARGPRTPPGGWGGSARRPAPPCRR